MGTDEGRVLAAHVEQALANHDTNLHRDFDALCEAVDLRMLPIAQLMAAIALLSKGKGKGK